MSLVLVFTICNVETDPEDIQTLLSQAPLMERKYQELAQRCLTSPVGKYLQYVGTAATVRDMVALADVIDGPGKPINFYGISYGTVIGSWFMNSEHSPSASHTFNSLNPHVHQCFQMCVSHDPSH